MKLVPTVLRGNAGHDAPRRLGKPWRRLNAAERV